MSGVNVSRDDDSDQLRDAYVDDAADAAGFADEQHSGARSVADGDINVQRFSLGPTVELSLHWWNRRIDYQVRHEPSNHEVLVTARTAAVWNVHIAIAVLLGCIVALWLVATRAVGVMAFLVIVVVFSLIIAGVLAYERKLAPEYNDTGDIVRLDAPVWEGIKQIIADDIAASPASRKMAYRKAQAEAALHRGAKKVRREDYINASMSDGASSSELNAKIHGFLRPDQLAEFDARLRTSYENDPALLESIGRGVRGCACQACAVMEAMDYTPEKFGAEARQLQPVIQVNTGNGIIDAIRKRRNALREQKIAREIARYESKRAADLERARKREREAKAKANVRKLRQNRTIS